MTWDLTGWQHRPDLAEKYQRECDELEQRAANEPDRAGVACTSCGYASTKPFASAVHHCYGPQHPFALKYQMQPTQPGFSGDY